MGVLVGKPAPDFTVAAVLGNGEIVDEFNFHETIKGKKAVLFFYPLDFTFVCPSELIAFDHRIEEFKKRNVEVVGVSIDSQFSHNAWRNTPVNEGGIGPVRYTLAADVKHEICQAYDVESEGGVAFRGSFLIDAEGVVRHTPVTESALAPFRSTLAADVKHEICQAYDVESEGGVAFRGSFLIDEEGIVRHQVVNDLPLGRNVDEMLRMVDALAFHQEHGEVCPAGWQEGDAGMKDSPEGVADYLSTHGDKL